MIAFFRHPVSTFIFGALVFAATVLLAETARAKAEPTSLGKFGAWNAYSLENSDGQELCYIVSEPTQKLPRNVDHGNVFMVITDWVTRKTRSEPSFLVGYVFKDASSVTAQIGDSFWEMFTYERGAWIRETSEEQALVRAMRQGATMRLKGTSSRGTQTEYTVSLSGVSAALNKIKGCT